MTKRTNAMIAATAIAAGALFSASAHAAIITGPNSLAGGNAIHLPASNQVGAGPVVFDTMTWSSNVATSLFGWTGGYTFGNATIAPGNPPLIALDAGHSGGGYATMTLLFPSLTSGFLGEFFWTDFTSAGNSVNVAAFDTNGNLLEFLFLNNNGNPIGNQAGFYGFSRAQADIAYVTINNGFIGARNLSWVGREINAPASGIPEPASWALMILGFGTIGLAMRRTGPERRVVLTVR